MRNGSRWTVWLTVVAVAASWQAACGESGQATASRSAAAPSSLDRQQLAQGELVYRGQCASCHGLSLEGQPNWREPLPDGGYPAPPHDGSGHTWRHSDQQLFDAIMQGGTASAGPNEKPNMPGFADVLSEDETWAAIAYIKSHWSPQLMARQRLVNRTRPHVHGETMAREDPRQ